MTDTAGQTWFVKQASDVIWIRNEALALTKAQGLSPSGAWDVTIAVCELATNIAKFAGIGEITLRPCEELGRRGVELVAEDRGPGIADPEAVLVDGFSEGRMISPEVAIRERRGLGCGLGAVRRAMSSLSIERREGGGARIVARRWIV